MLENLLTVLPTGTWHSLTRPWPLSSGAEVVLRWSPRPDGRRAVIADPLVHVTQETPRHSATGTSR
ncbi:hypothetical protein SAMN04487905_103242 [Actinopolyspora xinjiangensis]|uniref:Uncharacterized protein n=1 Tax=Actinopolyspora xinjiangensis TaxID=405564 RepID=A0A1H0RV10_9ACTN|nr:hypothetical protein [Actinopolyspora xinjiangensis]SDP33233.1 hypothetical protein SAMN04487905_103242 [Actinopolyspora xinjiangensis]